MPSNSSSRRLVLLFLSPPALLCASLAAAQTITDPSTPQADKERGVLQEIVVSAQRRSESLKDVPIAVNAFDDIAITNAGVTKLDDLTRLVPGLQVQNTLGHATSYLRGVGSSQASPGNEPSVATYVDDVYYADSGGAMTSLDNVERVEVLKGPQGTLYGRNATGGLIHVVTAAPQAKPSAKMEVAYENYQAVTASVFATGGLSDQLKGSLSAKVRNQEQGYGRNVLLGTERGIGDYENFRGKLLWQPTDADRLTVGGSYFKNRGDLGNFYSIFPGTFNITGQTALPNRQDTQTDVDAKTVTEAWDTSLVWQHNISRNSTLKSISAYRHVLFTFNNYDIDTGPVFVLGANFRTDSWTIQQEFLLQGDADLLGRRLEYTAGVFYFKLRADYPLDVLVGLPVVFDLPSSSDLGTESYAGYAQADYHLSDRDTLTTGFRYTKDKQSIVQHPTSLSGDISNTKPTWRLSLKHDLTADWMTYVSYNRGFKSGSFNSSSTTVINSVKPEILDTYSVGSKSTFLDHSLQLNAEGFYYDYKNLQVITFDGVSTNATNAAKARVYGLDLDGSLAVPVKVGDLLLNLGWSLLKSEYLTYENCQLSSHNPLPPGGNTISRGDCSGNQINFAPKSQANLGFNYSAAAGTNGGKMGLSANYSYNSGYYFEPDNVGQQKSFGLLAADLSYTFPQEAARVRVYGSNLTDRTVWTNFETSAYVAHAGTAAPRTFGIAFEYNWH